MFIFEDRRGRASRERERERGGGMMEGRGDERRGTQLSFFLCSSMWPQTEVQRVLKSSSVVLHGCGCETCRHDFGAELQESFIHLVFNSYQF